MKELIRSIGIAVRRNPVINAFLLAVALQVMQDWRADNIDFAHLAGYVATVCIAVATRMFVVPSKEHETTLDNLHTELYLARKGDVN